MSDWRAFARGLLWGPPVLALLALLALALTVLASDAPCWRPCTTDAECRAACP